MSKKLVEVRLDVMRCQSLDGPYVWAKGDFTKVFDDGSEEPATFDEYRRYNRLLPTEDQEIQG